MGEDSIQGVTGADVGRGVAIANAQLIAAAPELYEALDLCRDWLESTGADGSPIHTVHAALAKARGEA